MHNIATLSYFLPTLPFIKISFTTLNNHDKEASYQKQISSASIFIFETWRPKLPNNINFVLNYAIMPCRTRTAIEIKRQPSNRNALKVMDNKFKVVNVQCLVINTLHSESLLEQKVRLLIYIF